MTQSYGTQYHTYPVFAEEMSHEGAFKRFTHFPGPHEVFQMALFGLPKVSPLTGEVITEEMAAPYLESAVAEIEMVVGCTLSPVVRFHSDDHIDGLFERNFMGIRLQSWPATEVISVKLKYPHTNTASIYQTYTIPSNWVYLRKNKINIVAAVGAVTVSTDNSSMVTAGGLFTYITGFGRGAYQPGVLEVVYKAGFEHDKLPSSVADLIKTWAAHRMLCDFMPILFPTSSLTDSIDGVSQSVTYNIHMTLANRIKMLEQKKTELAAALTKQFSKTLKTTYLGT
jgi:hypothetical protein